MRQLLNIKPKLALLSKKNNFNNRGVDKGSSPPKLILLTSSSSAKVICSNEFKERVSFVL